MQHSFFHRLGNTLWVAMLALIVLLAVYIGAGRLLSANLNAYRIPLLDQLNARLPFTLQAQEISGSWHSFSPELVLSNLTLDVPGDAEPPLALAAGRLSVNVLHSLRTASLQLNHLTLEELSIRGELSSEGRFAITGLGGGGSGEIGGWLQEFLSNVERITLEDNVLTMDLPSGESRKLDLDIELSRRGSHRRLQGTLMSTAGTRISVLATGVGDPLRPETFTGSAYLDVHTPDLEAMRALLGPGAPPFWASGEGQMELWLTLSEGEPAVEARMSASNLLVYSDDGKLQLPLDSVALEARLLRENDTWTLFASDFELVQGETQLQLSRGQLDVWGSAARVRLENVPLQPLNAIATGLEVVPQNLRDIFTTLEPRGSMETLQINIGDIYKPMTDWEVDTNFADLAVESFSGAPGVTAARGYAHLHPGGGEVVLDSQDLTLDFPSIYKSSLDFDVVYGSLGLQWDAQIFTLSSGLLTAYGKEGKARVLFGLDVPLQKTEAGVEMQLLVGLQNTDTQLRDKYIPYTLSAGLRQWLANSIGAGTIEQGAFLWRGSLRSDAAALRTVQLAFNVSDTSLDYHEKWPAVMVGTGRVLIDDAAVSVWSEDASLYASRVNNLSVELSQDSSGDLLLALDGTVEGTAADGLRVVNESALADIVGKAFVDWDASGEMEAQLNILLNLSDNTAPPQVDVVTNWRKTALEISPGNLRVQGLEGNFNYSTTEGFSSSGLQGELWDKPIVAQLRQRHPDSNNRYQAKSSELDIVLNTRVEMSDVQDWLKLDLLGFAQGETAAEIVLAVVPGEPPSLRAESALQGVALDLPAPFNKGAQQAQQLSYSMQLGKEGLPMSLLLGEYLKLDMNVEGGTLRAGNLVINQAMDPLQSGYFRINGQTPYLDGDELLRFLSQYLSLGDPFSKSEIVDSVTSTGSSEVGAAGSPEPIQFRVEKLHADMLDLKGRKFDNVEFSLAQGEDAWAVEIETDWFAGRGQMRRAPQVSTIAIEHMDLSALQSETGAELEDPESEKTSSGGIVSKETEPQLLQFPDADVSIANLTRGEQHLGNVAFSLRSTGRVIEAKNIIGTLAGFTVQDQEPASLLWRQGEGGHTQFTGALSFEDLGESLKIFGYEKTLETKSGVLDAGLRWPGAPQEFALREGRGFVLVDIAEGSFLEAPAGAAGALRVVSVLNLADIVRRLSLTQMFDSGIAFDSVDGEIYLHGGTVEVARMEVNGSSSFQFSGVSEVARRSLNGELVATLPVANNLPWVAALAASLPIAAGVFVVSKVFDKQMNRLSSGVYSIEGTWDEPRVEFDRIFDDTAKAVEIPDAVDVTSSENPEVTETPKDSQPSAP